MSACSPRTHSARPAPYSSDAGAPIPATAPYLLMRDGAVGLAVWPSGHSWVLLRTTDGWRHVQNRTPPAVPTGGGLVAAAVKNDVVVVVGGYERLTRSPVLTSGTTGPWHPSELPGAVSNSRAAVSIAAGHVSAVLAPEGGTVVAQAGEGWTRLTSAAALAPGGGLRVDSVTWASATLGWLGGHGLRGTAIAFQTSDAGRTWVPLPQATGGPVAALAPCGEGSSRLLPLVDGHGTVRVDHTTDSGKTWRTGGSVPLWSGSPAWGCHGSQVWIAGRAGHAEHVFASNDSGQTWVDAGVTPPGLTDLSPTGNGAGFAASTASHGAILWSVTGDGARFTPLALPGWVARLGAQTSGS